MKTIQIYITISNPSSYTTCMFEYDWCAAYLRFSQMALTLRTLLGTAEPVPRNSSSGETPASLVTTENIHNTALTEHRTMRTTCWH